jgi:hypothetical protein
VNFPSIESVAFDTTQMTPLPDENTPDKHAWLTPERDLVLLNLFCKAPDVPARLDQIDALRAAYRKIANAQGCALIEAEVVDAGSCRAIWLIVRSYRKPHGSIYVASLTLPFHDFSFVLKAQCEERGMTGIREAMVLPEVLNAAPDDSFVVGAPPQGWLVDLYDSNLRTQPLRNVSEDEKYDAKFPDHPLSRVRRLIRHLDSSLVVSPEVKAAMPF